ncbi:conserved hypothetical protein [Histoplasma capsulatum G186AR]|uniref:C2 domain-containing protein n=2 Tax=Ajellomyces capsulatus TaxID=5037 RepID=C0NZI2_AJECG|nr:uncharacterized protein HCBG_08562 [Histoplasma capsulatum G186AR]EEH03230.1 conserved hypothetical protein [Histoplasma capsulatum G186AR]KAG5290369.1 conserved serine proline-rich protein [Histoplasma capsulatum]QSS72296.1 conserved serine proline-rich protein [Histoplasma capsulatum G186AR]
MVSKLSKPSQVSQHTAGIFADMSVDGPPIGTLVAIIDRAKNLPNRKSMGKQNPYCAARLGKEAKKTETDMRGGQTPKWDQELRFTVHESPDYTQLKVSVFNDDKKTDLIGETWIDIKNVIIPGGGQNDFWHSLQCKGKYAGDIRIELTFYDTRPKDEAVIERRKETEKVEAKTETVQSGLSGPRQAKPLKRRPLPADPTGSSLARPSSSDHARPSSRDNHPTPTRQQIQAPPQLQPHPQSQPHPQPQPGPPTQIPRTYETPDDFNRSWGPPPPTVVSKHTPPMPQPYQRPPPREVQELPADQYDRRPPPPMPLPREMAYPQEPEYNHHVHNNPHQPLDHGLQRSLEQNGYEYPAEPTQRSRDTYQTPPRQHSYIMPAPENYSGGPPSYPPPSSGSPYGAVESQPQVPEPSSQSLVMANAGDRRSPYHQHSSSHSNNDSFLETPLRNSVNQTDFHPRHEYRQPHVQDEDEDGPPPPPPVHRQGFQQHQQQHHHQQQHSSPPLLVEYSQNEMGAIPMPDPLNVGPGRTSPMDDQQTYVAYSPSYENQNFSSAETEPVYSTSPTPSNNNSYRHDRGRSQDRPSTSNGETVPSALRPGYEAPDVDERDRNMYNGHPERQQSYVRPPPPQPTPPSQLVRVSPSIVAERPHRTTPDLRHVPPRKSLSPHPSPSEEPGTLDGIPFSPDSFDALNPHISTASALQQPAPPYGTPEGAMEAARQREVEKLRDLGPIIGNDGRVIDPSDHLPTDTWAPEPERKSRKPEIVVRFKHAPQNSTRFSPRESTATRSSLSSSEKVTKARPHSMAPAQSYSQGHSPNPPPQQTINSNSTPQSLAHLQQQGTRPYSYIQPSTVASGNDLMYTQNHNHNHHHSPSQRPNNAFSGSERNSYGYNGNNNINTPPYANHSHNPRTSVSPSPNPASHQPQFPSNHQPPRHSHSHYHSHSPTSSSISTAPPIPAKVPVHSSGSGGGGELDALSEEMRRIDIGVSGGGVGGAGNAGRRGRARVSYVGGGGPGYAG